MLHKMLSFELLLLQARHIRCAHCGESFAYLLPTSHICSSTGTPLITKDRKLEDKALAEAIWDEEASFQVGLPISLGIWASEEIQIPERHATADVLRGLK